MALIVIAEDELLIADVLTIMLEDAGHEVESAPHGQAALFLAKETRPDLVITDFMMPLMTGLELAQALRADEELSGIPIILVSGAQATFGQSYPEMFDAVLDKPHDETRLLKAVESALAGKSLI
jgi:CheY-like chemotaxis protein